MAEWTTYPNHNLAPCLGRVVTVNASTLTVILYPSAAPAITVTLPMLGVPADYAVADTVLVVFRTHAPNSGTVTGILYT